MDIQPYIRKDKTMDKENILNRIEFIRIQNRQIMRTIKDIENQLNSLWDNVSDNDYLLCGLAHELVKKEETK